jgi:diadenosine tetraphosphate (Ap4A) HIT family hydrolase
MHNETMVRFGHPDSLVRAYQHWSVLVRREQVTAGSLVLAAQGEARRLSDLPLEAFTEFGTVVVDLERVLSEFVGYDKINYLMLMMVDPHVHYHVLPRHAEPREICGVRIVDHGWPKAPSLGETTTLTPDRLEAVRDALRERWPGVG